MKYLSEKDDVSKLENGLKNKFRWEWLAVVDEGNEKIGVWCKKIDEAGKCFCICCNTSIKYSNEGLKSLKNHSKSLTHKQARESVIGSQVLNALYPINGSIFQNNDDENKRTLDTASRKARGEALVLSFIAENSLSFSMAPKLIELAKTLSMDITSLNSMQMSRSAAAYKMKYGLAKTIKEEQNEELKASFFSMNIDESTSRSSESILALLVQYFSESQSKVVLRHFASVKLSACNAMAIYSAIVSLFEESDIPWKNLVSLLMDSCNTMRGKKNGVETKIRAIKAPHLIDIDGDTCHTANNCAKKFTEPFLKHLEILMDNIYFDLKSADKREFFFNICNFLKIKPLKPLSRPDHRWLYVLVVTERLKYLWDALLVFYFSWIDEDVIYEDLLTEVYQRRELLSHEIKSIKEIQSGLKQKTLTTEGKDRKRRIVQRLFEQQKKTLFLIKVYESVLPHFNCYVKLFQRKECQLHELHVQMFNLTKKFLAFFLKHELISKIDSYSEILKIDVTNKKNHLPDRLIFTGAQEAHYSDMKEMKEVLKTAYSRCALYMLKKLPLNNSLLIKLSALNPALRGETTTFTALINLAELLPNVIAKEEVSILDSELRDYQTDSTLSCRQSDDLISFWIYVMKVKNGNMLKYPVLSKMVKAVLSCFHGPSVESAFNYMDDIVTESRTSLNIESLDSIQTVKYYLNSLGQSTCDVFGSEDPMHEPIQGNFGRNLLSSWSSYNQILSSKSVTSNSSELSTDHSEPQESCSISNRVQNVPVIEGSQIKRKMAQENKNKVKQTKIGHFFKK